jgi:hypothetical protein
MAGWPWNFEVSKSRTVLLLVIQPGTLSRWIDFTVMMVSLIDADWRRASVKDADTLGWTVKTMSPLSEAEYQPMPHFGLETGLDSQVVTPSVMSTAETFM